MGWIEIVDGVRFYSIADDVAVIRISIYSFVQQITTPIILLILLFFIVLILLSAMLQIKKIAKGI